MIEKMRMNPRETKEAIRGFWSYEEFDRALSVLSHQAETTLNTELRTRMVRTVRMAMEYALPWHNGIRTCLLPYEHGLVLHASCMPRPEGLVMVAYHHDVIARSQRAVPFGDVIANGGKISI